MIPFRRRRNEPAPPPPADLPAADAAIEEARQDRRLAEALWQPARALSDRLRQQRIENHFAARFEAAYGRRRTT